MDRREGLREEIERKRKELTELEKKAATPWPRRTTLYLHGCKESGWEVAEELGLEGKAASDFAYALYEVEFDVEVNKDGSYRILKVCEGSQVLRPVDKS